MKESDIFLAASQIESPEVRSAFLDSVCGDDAQLLKRVQRLLRDFESWEGAVDRFTGELPERLAAIHKEDRDRFDQGNGNSRMLRTYGLSAGQKFEHYTIETCLGVGGMGEVYLANDLRLNRKVALKILPLHRTEDPDWVRRFLDEARSVSALNHPNILTVFEIGQHDDVRFMVTEYVEGQTLRAALENNSLSLIEKVRVGVDMAGALHAAHAAGIIHRDLKPENVMLRHDGLLKVLDFGLAKQYEPSLNSHLAEHDREPRTDPALMLGTVRYMSPEQVRRQQLDYRSDIFCLGVVLYELLSGQLPFPGLTDADIMAAIIQTDAPPITDTRIPDELKRLIAIMLRKDRTKRLMSAKEIMVELELIHAQLNSADSKFQLQRALTGSGFREEGVDGGQEDLSVPAVHYARSGDVNIAYQVLGAGEIDIVFVMGWVSHLDWFWKEPSFARFLRRLASFSRLILFDKRGTGLSDRVPPDQLPTLEQRIDDVRAVMEAVGSDRAVLCGVSEGGPLCSLFAATHPQKTTALVMIGCYARRLRADNYPWGPTDEQHHHFLEDIRVNWGGPVGIEARAPSRASDPAFRAWWATYLRMGASPGAALALTRMNSQIDIRPILPTIRVPTLVVHRRGDMCLRVEEGKYLADNIPGAQFVELGGHDHLPFVGQQDEILDSIEQFLTGVSHDSHIRRILATVLVASIQSPPQPPPQPPRQSPDHASGHSGSQSAEIAMSHAVREVELFRGKPFASDPSSVVATFDGPARAVRAAMAILSSGRRLGVSLRIGVHTGECEEHDGQVRGPAVDTAVWVSRQASVNQILVSSTVKDLVAGAELTFSQCDTMVDGKHSTNGLFFVRSS